MLCHRQATSRQYSLSFSLHGASTAVFATRAACQKAIFGVLFNALRAAWRIRMTTQYVKEALLIRHSRHRFSHDSRISDSQNIGG
ncbi:hypothetical protein Q3G72_029232 [Acer saccharum]|nr:hypothetical protein Q3G72_029232 [Acer saccharum]